MTEHNRLGRNGVLAAILAFLLTAGLFAAALGTDTRAAESQSAQEAAAAAVNNEDYYFNWKTQQYTAVDLSKGSVTITQSGIYALSGVLSDGTVTVDINKDLDDGTVFLVLNGADITSQSGTPLNVVDAEKVVLLLEAGTENSVTQGAVTNAAEDFPSAAIFSKADLTITGEGSLTVTTAYNDGITSKDDLIVTDGNITVTAAQDGLVGKDLVSIEAGTLVVTAGKDGVKATNDEDAEKGCIAISGGDLTIDAGGDAIEAETSLSISGGTFRLSGGGGFTAVTVSEDGFGDKSGGIPGAQTAAESDGVSGKALKAGTAIAISGGDFTLASSEDAVHTDGDVTISGGTFSIQAGDDAIHGDASVHIEGGQITIAACNEGVESAADITVDDGVIVLDSEDDGFNVSDASGVLTINGGSITMTAAGDGLDSNGSIVQNGGSVVITLNGTADEMYVDSNGYTGSGGTITDANGSAVSTSQSFGGMGGGMHGGW